MIRCLESVDIFGVGWVRSVVPNSVDGTDDMVPGAENTRAAYPIEYIPNVRLPCVGPHPKNIILLSCDAFGVLPPVSKLTHSQTMYHFISGYTALVRLSGSAWVECSRCGGF